MLKGKWHYLCKDWKLLLNNTHRYSNDLNLAIEGDIFPVNPLEPRFLQLNLKGSIRLVMYIIRYLDDLLIGFNRHSQGDDYRGLITIVFAIQAIPRRSWQTWISLPDFSYPIAHFNFHDGIN